jgi:hypothetical protein
MQYIIIPTNNILFINTMELPFDILLHMMTYLNRKSFFHLLQTCRFYINNKNYVVNHQITHMLNLIELPFDCLKIIGIDNQINKSIIYCKLKQYIYESPPQIMTYTSRTYQDHTQIIETNAYVIPSYFMRHIFPVGFPIYIRTENNNLLNIIQSIKMFNFVPVTFFATIVNVPKGYIPILKPQYIFSLYDIKNKVYVEEDYKISLMKYFKLCDPSKVDINNAIVFTLAISCKSSKIKIYNSSINENKIRKMAMLEQVMSLYVNTYIECDSFI